MTTIKNKSGGKEITPPKYPWTKGVTDQYRCFSLDVEVLQTNNGHVFSNHKANDDLDDQTVSTFPNGGLEQIAFGLLMEAVRRETFIVALVNLTKNSDFVKEYLLGDKDKKLEMEVSLSKEVVGVLEKNISQMAFPTAKEIMYMLASNEKQ